jgi:hypothetical protein
MTADHDKPTLRDEALELDRLTADEVDALAGAVDAVIRHHLPTPMSEQQRALLDRVLRKLTAERQRRGLPAWEDA